MNESPGGIWVGEWKGSHPIVVFDLEAQKPGGRVVTFYSVSKREWFDLLPHRVSALVKRIGSAETHPEAIAAYELARAARPRKPPRSSTRSPSRRAPLHASLPAHVDVRIADDLFDEDWRAFDRMFPGGFESPEYLEQERNYKLRTRESLAALTPEAFVSLDEPELVTLVQRSFGATDNLLHRFEHTAIHGCLQLEGPERTRALQALGALLWEDASSLEDRFSEWATALGSLPKAGPKSPSSWPVATALPFLTRPDIHCILKPTNARAFTKRYGFELGYDAQPNFITYGRWLCFVKAIEARLTPLGARDRLDVQSFLWRVDPAKGVHLA